MLTDDSLQALVESALGRSVETIAPVPHGSVNQVFRLAFATGEEAILRIAPAGADLTASWMTADGLRREQAAYALLEPIRHLLPRTIHADFTRETIDRDWVVQSVVPGAPWPVSAVTMETWEQLGQMVRAIHAVAGTWFGPPSHGIRAPTWTALVRDDLAGFRADAARYGAEPPVFDAIDAFLDAHAATLDAVTPTLIHSDLALDHVFVREGRVSGLIDLEFARFADPLSEGLLLELLDRDDAASDAFFRGYGGRPEVDPVRLRLARLLVHAWSESDRLRLGDADS